jgi:hypothetical protein
MREIEFFEEAFRHFPRESVLAWNVDAAARIDKRTWFEFLIAVDERLRLTTSEDEDGQRLQYLKHADKGVLIEVRDPPLERLYAEFRKLGTDGRRAVILAFVDRCRPPTVQGHIRSLSPLHHPRMSSRLALLAAGRVLCVGGRASAEGEESSLPAELWSPDSEAWVAAAQPRWARTTGHSLTSLEANRALVCGGFGKTAKLAELYDAVSNAWSSAGTLRTARGGHLALAQPDGTVRVIGGCRAPDHTGALRECETWHAPAGFEPAPQLLAARAQPLGAQLADGSTLVIGGTRSSPDASSTAEILCPGASHWQNVRPPPVPILDRGGAAIPLPDGRALFVVPGTVILYDSGRDQWTAVDAKFTDPYRTGFGGSATLLPDMRVLVLSGRWSFDDDYEGAQLFDPRGLTWTLAGLKDPTPKRHVAVSLGDGRVLIVGGSAGGRVPRAGAETLLWEPPPTPGEVR